MTKTEYARLDQIVRNTNDLLMNTGNGITNADVIEAMLGDIIRVQGGRAPEELAALVRADETGPTKPG